MSVFLNRNHLLGLLLVVFASHCFVQPLPDLIVMKCWLQCTWVTMVPEHVVIGSQRPRVCLCLGDKAEENSLLRGNCYVTPFSLGVGMLWRGEERRNLTEGEVVVF